MLHYFCERFYLNLIIILWSRSNYDSHCTNSDEEIKRWKIKKGHQASKKKTGNWTLFGQTPEPSLHHKYLPDVFSPCESLKFQSHWTTSLSLNRHTSPAHRLVTADASGWSALLWGRVSLFVVLVSIQYSQPMWLTQTCSIHLSVGGWGHLGTCVSKLNCSWIHKC